MRMKKWIALLLAALTVLSLSACGGSTKEDNSEPGTVVITTAPVSIPVVDPESDPELQNGATTVVITATSTTATSTTAASTAAPATAASGWENAPANELYRPAASLFVDQYTAYAYCIDTDVQNYVKMRLGPSIEHFNVTGSKVPNNTKVTVETKSVNGWTLCYVNGTEGWIRSDFLRATPGPDETATATTAAQTVCSGQYFVTVTGEYADEPLNMRSGPSRETELITTIPNREIVEIGEDETVQDGWVRVTYNGQTGYVLYKYLERNEGVGDKPVLYLYPEKETDVDVTLTLAKGVFFSCTYPAYGAGWKVTAAPDGTLTDRTDGKQYSCLYWELAGRADYTFDEGFCVKGGDTAAFLEKTLTEIGLSPRERNEFIIYWLPRMQHNAWNLISFQKETYTDLVGLEITPAPDSLLRVFMAYKPVDAPVEIPAQHFSAFARTGFTAVEWGGVKVSAD